MGAAPGVHEHPQHRGAVPRTCGRSSSARCGPTAEDCGRAIWCTMLCHSSVFVDVSCLSLFVRPSLLNLAQVTFPEPTGRGAAATPGQGTAP